MKVGIISFENTPELKYYAENVKTEMELRGMDAEIYEKDKKLSERLKEMNRMYDLQIYLTEEDRLSRKVSLKKGFFTKSLTINEAAKEMKDPREWEIERNEDTEIRIGEIRPTGKSDRSHDVL